MLGCFSDRLEELSLLYVRGRLGPMDHNHHNVLDLQFLEDGQELLARAVFLVVVKALCQHFLLLDWVRLIYTIGKNLMPGLAELLRRYCPCAHLRQVIKNLMHMLFM